MIEIIDGKRKQTPGPGNILSFNDEFSKEVYLGDGMPLWDEIPDTGQLEKKVDE